MGDSAAYLRFVGLKVDDAAFDKLDTDFGDGVVKEVDGIKFTILSSQFGEAPHWLVRSDAKSLCRFSYVHWDGHGGGAEDFDFHADPFDPRVQKLMNISDASSLGRLEAALKKRGYDLGPIELVFGWLGSPDFKDWTEGLKRYVELPDAPKVRELQQVVSYGPWRTDQLEEGITETDEGLISEIWQVRTKPPNEIFELPYGRAIDDLPAIPVRTKEESERLFDKCNAEHRAWVNARYPEPK